MELAASALCASLRVDDVAEVLPGFEADVLGGRNGDLLVRARIAAFASLARDTLKLPSPGIAQALPRAGTNGNVSDERIKRCRSLLLGDPGCSAIAVRRLPYLP